MSVAIITGSAGLIGAEAVRFFSSKGFQVVGIDNDMRKAFFGDDASTEWSRRDLDRRHSPLHASRDRHPGSRRRSSRAVRRVRHRHQADRPHRRPALARLGREGPAHRLLRQRQRHADPAGSDPQVLPRGRASSSRPPTRSTATTPTACRWSSSRRGGRSTPSHPYYEHGIDENLSVDQTQALAVRRLQARRRRDGPGVRPLLRHEHRLLPRRLPDRPGPLRHR